jgi:hypothetical protein
MFEYRLLHGILLVLITVGHVGMEVVVQLDYAITEFTLTFVPDLCM